MNKEFETPVSTVSTVLYFSVSTVLYFSFKDTTKPKLNRPK